MLIPTSLEFCCCCCTCSWTGCSALLSATFSLIDFAISRSFSCILLVSFSISPVSLSASFNGSVAKRCCSLRVISIGFDACCLSFSTGGSSSPSKSLLSLAARTTCCCCSCSVWAFFRSAWSFFRSALSCSTSRWSCSRRLVQSLQEEELWVVMARPLLISYAIFCTCLARLVAI